MTILLFGAGGQVGSELTRALAPLGLVTALTRAEADLARADEVEAMIAAHRPDVIVNAAAYTAVDRAEDEEDAAFAINANAVARMAEAGAKHGALFVHYSTDYVFDGQKPTPYSENDAPAPLNAYGRTKLAGEEAVVEAGGPHMILRTSWVYGARGRNFAATMLRLAAERDELTVVADQLGAPTSAELIADATALCIHAWLREPARRAEREGLFHLAAAGETSWHGFARFLVSGAAARGMALRATPENVRAIATKDYPTPARRPLNSRLATAKLEDRFGLQMPDWRHHAARYLDAVSMG